MADSKRARLISQSSSDSSCLDPVYTYIDVEADRGLLPHRKSIASEGRGEKSRCCCSLVVVSLVVSVVTLLALAGTVVYFNLYSCPVKAAVQDDGKVCMPCTQVSPDPVGSSPWANQNLLDVHREEEVDICCASTPAQYAALFQLIVKRQEEVKKLADIFGSTDSNDGEPQSDGSSDSVGNKTVSAHLVSKPMVGQYKDAEDHVIQQWKSQAESPLSHVRQGLQFHEHKLYVQRPGLYFVYCQILYNRAHPDTSPHPSLASHYVSRYSIAYPSSSGILLKARHTRASGEDDRHSSCAGGLFFLHVGDYLYVKVSAPELVSYDDQASFFGLFKVGN